MLEINKENSLQCKLNFFSYKIFYFFKLIYNFLIKFFRILQFTEKIQEQLISLTDTLIKNSITQRNSNSSENQNSNLNKNIIGMQQLNIQEIR